MISRLAPQGIAFDPQGNIVVTNIGNNEVLTFSAAGQLVKTETAVQPGNDGLVILPDGITYVGSVQNGGVSRIRPGCAAELIAQNIPSPACMCYDAGASQLVIPMNANNALAFIPLERDVELGAFEMNLRNHYKAPTRIGRSRHDRCAEPPTNRID